jgi:hypothetical protein
VDDELMVFEGEVMGLTVRLDPANAFANFWNPNDARVFPPTNFGVGWDINFHALLVAFGLLSRRSAR